ncbi:MAG: hypothetical protein GY714_01015 [Desulfobacterales bacterium]|nr:hypothetical protein [Desulfobacterales bacterium]MCP4161334.1 hypothetical protein [Deltaproteobacteria bacterium]
MRREPTTLPGKTWEFFSACIFYLGKSTLTSLFQRGDRQIERWSADPSTSGSQKNPIDRYEVLLNKIVEAEHVDVARSVVSRQAHIVGCELVSKDMPLPDKDSVEHEIIDDTPLKVAYDETLLRDKVTQEECRIAMDNYIKELKENYVRKCLDMDWTP